MRKKQLLIVFVSTTIFFLILSIGNYKVSANTFIEGEGLSGGMSSANSCQSSDNTPLWCYSIEILNGRSGLIQGIRMTVVDKHGIRVGGTTSVDFIKDNKYTNPSDHLYTIGQAIRNRQGEMNGIYFTTQKNTRMWVINSMNLPIVNSYGTGARYSHVLLDPNEKGVFPDYLTTKGTTANLVSYFTNKNNISYEEFKEIYLDNMGYDYEDYVDNDEYKDHSIVIEPITYYSVLYGNEDIKRYIGTITELFKMMEHHTISGPGDRPNEIKQWDVSLIVNQFYSGLPYINNLLPMSIYLPENKFGLRGISPSPNQFFTVGPVGSCHPDARGSNVDGRERCRERTNKVSYIDMLGNTTASINILYLNDLVDKPNDCDFSNPNVLLLECCEEDGAKGHRLYDHICDLDTDDDKPNCDTKSSIGDCTSLTQTSIEETKNWGSCIYNNSDYREISRSYCNVYCSETVSTNFPGGLHATALAGHHFLLQPTISITSQKECRAQVDLEGLKGNVERSKKSVESAFNEWQRQKARSSLISDGFNESETIICDTDCNNPYYVCKSEEDTLLPNGMDCQPPTPPADLDEDGNVIKTYPKPDPYRGEKKCNPETNYYLKTPRTSRKNYYNHQGNSVSTSIGSYCRPSARPTSSVSTARKVYEDSLKTMERTIDNINNCYTWVNTLQYNTNPNMFVNFEYMNQIQDIKLIPYFQPESRVRTQYNEFGDEETIEYVSTRDQISTLECYDSSRGCVEINRSGLPWNKVNAVTINKTIRYSLPPDTYRYVDKTTSISSNYPSNGGLYFDIGSANIPVHYSTLPGTKNLTFRYSDLGTNGKFNSVIGSVNNYYCNYNVEKGFVIPDPTPGGSGGGRGDVYDYNFVYRPIDLSTPFPGKDGNGRSIGSNWSGNENLIKEDVFNQEPKYRITLDNRSIRAIRDYNKTNPYDNFDMTCDQGYNCKSNFLREEFMQGVIVINQDINYNPIVSR